MRFAYLRHRSAITQELATWVAKMADGGYNTYALLDGSMFEQNDLEHLARRSVNFQPALAGSPLESYGSHGPLLCALGPDTTPGLNALLRRTDGIPGLSFIASRCDRTALSARLIWLAVAQTDDGPPMHCRFADTRVLPALLDSLRPDQRALLAKDVAEWTWIARDATLQAKAFPSAEAAAPSAENAPFDLDEKQFASLLTSVEPDMVFQMLDQKMPELIANAAPHDIHARLVRLLAAARSHGIADLPDLFQFSVVGLCTTDHFDQHPAVQETWRLLKTGDGRFSELAQQWPEEVWRALDQNESLQQPDN